MIAGVVAGLADRFGIDRSMARIAYTLLSILSVAFPGILVYIICWIIMPEGD
jgi:phage shock protein C